MKDFFRFQVSKELPAFENQLKNANLRGVSQEYKLFLERMISEALQMYTPLNKITDKKLFYELVPANVEKILETLNKAKKKN